MQPFILNNFMKKFIFVSLLIHLIIACSLITISTKQSNDRTQPSFINKKKDVNDIALNKNIKREEVMNAIAVSEEDLELEIQRIKEIDSFEKNEKLNKLMQIENEIKIKKEDLMNLSIKEEVISNNKESNLSNKINNLQAIQNKIKEQQKDLSYKENLILQEKNKLEKDRAENLKILDLAREQNLENNESLKQKQKHIQEQSEYIRMQEEEIKKLESKLNKKYGKNSKQTVVTDKKESSGFLNKLSDSDQEKIKLEVANHNLIIKNKIYKKWILPENITNKTDCIIDLTQSDTGVVLAIKFTSCTNNEKIKNSIRKAVTESSPLPLPDNKELFDRHIQLYFTVN